MKQKELHQKMPNVAAFIDDLCEAFGNAEIHGQIRRGLAGEPTFFAQENGYAIGTPLPKGYGIVFDPVTQSPVDANDAPIAPSAQDNNEE